jgi:hypothetical protein
MMFRHVHFWIQIKEKATILNKKIIFPILLVVIGETRNISSVIVPMFYSERVSVLKLYTLYNIIE